MANYSDEMIRNKSVTWEWLADNGLVDPQSIDGLSDPIWLIGDDIMADEDRTICDAVPGAVRIATSSAGLLIELE